MRRTAWILGARGHGLSGPIAAETPKDTVVMAKQIDDLISLDPARSSSSPAARSWARLRRAARLQRQQGERAARPPRRELGRRDDGRLYVQAQEG